MFNKNDGFTFIEIMLTIVVLAVITTTIVPGIIMGLRGIITEGNKEAALYNTQSEIDKSIAIATGNSDEIVIIFNKDEAEEKEVTINGELLVLSSTYTTNKADGIPGEITISYFRPAK